MERLSNLYDKESMKIAMLKHEETFKEQVYELHRLYQIQKMLMKNSRPYVIGLDRRNGVKYINKERPNPQRKLDLERPAEEYITDEDEMLEMDDESDIELTLGPTKFRRRKKDETPINSDTGPSFSSSSNESSFIQKTSTNTHKRMDTREDLTGHEWGIQVPNIHPSLQNGKIEAFEVDEQFRQERPNRPPWLFHVLNLSMT